MANPTAATKPYALEALVPVPPPPRGPELAVSHAHASTSLTNPLQESNMPRTGTAVRTSKSTSTRVKMVRSIIAANPHACYRTLQGILDRAGFEDYESILAEARRSCGYDCEDRCPVSGRPES